MHSADDGYQTMKMYHRRASAGMLFVVLLVWMGLMVMLFYHKQVALYDAFARSTVASRKISSVVQLFDAHMRRFISSNASLLYHQQRQGQPHHIWYTYKQHDRVYQFSQQLRPHGSETMISTTTITESDRVVAQVRHTISCLPDTARIIAHEWSRV